MSAIMLLHQFLHGLAARDNRVACDVRAYCRYGTIHETAIAADLDLCDGRAAGRRRDGGRPGARDRERRVAHLRRQSLAQPVFATRPDHRGELQRAGARVALQHRQLRAPTGDQFRVDAADGQRCGLHHRRHPPRRGRARRCNGRAALDASAQRGRAGRGSAAQAVRPRAHVLGRRWERRHPVCHARLPAGRPQRPDRCPDPELRRGGHRRPEAEHRPGSRTHLRNRACTRRRSSPATRSSSARRICRVARHRRARTSKATSAASTSGPAIGNGSSTRFSTRTSSGTTAG